MKKFLFALTIALFFTACEKDSMTATENILNRSATVEFRSDDPALALVESLITKVTELMAAGTIDTGVGNSLLSKLESIKKKLSDGKREAALSKLEELQAHLESLISSGHIDPDVAEELTNEVESASCATAPFDGDGDGWLCTDDCDDSDAAVHPEAAEICGNGIDDDCDGAIDEVSEELLTVVLPDGSTLYVHPTDNHSAIQWSPALFNAASLEDFGDIEAALLDYQGAYNTSKISADLPEEGTWAARLCDELIAYGCDNWYLPALGELQAIYEQLGPAYYNGFENDFYWSSTEIYKFDAGYAYFNYEGEPPKLAIPKNKNDFLRCRCVRK